MSFSCWGCQSCPGLHRSTEVLRPKSTSYLLRLSSLREEQLCATAPWLLELAQHPHVGCLTVSSNMVSTSSFLTTWLTPPPWDAGCPFFTMATPFDGPSLCSALLCGMLLADSSLCSIPQLFPPVSLSRAVF